MNKQKVLENLNIRAYYSSELPGIRWNESGMGLALCPFHDDTRASLSINLHTGQFKCFGCDTKGSVFDFYMKRHGVDYKIAFNALAKEAGLATEPEKKIVKTYDYVGESGNLLFQTVRYEPKDFKQRRPDGNGGWIWNLRNTRLVPYDLPKVLKAESVVIAEGEKDAENLKALGFAATCNPLGAGKWSSEFNRHFVGKKIAIIPDNDEAGKRHAQLIARNLKPVAESIKIVELPNLGEKGDISDWLTQGHTKEELLDIIKQTPEWKESSEEFISRIPTLSDIASLNLTVEYVVDGLFPQRSVSIVYGKGGRGKTTLLMQIGYCISQGIPFEGLPTKRLPVVYLDYDNPLDIIVEKAKRLGHSDNFYYWHISSDLKLPKMDSNEWAIFKKLPQNAFLIVDTLKSCQLLDMNKDETMAFILERFRELRDKGFTIAILHHTPKNSDTIPKNNTTITDNADHVLGLVPLIVEGENTDGLLWFGCGENDKSRYPKKHVCLSFDGELFEKVPDPEDTKYNDMVEVIAELLSKGGKLPNQSSIILASKERLNLSRPKIIELLNRGEGKYWTSKRLKEFKNQKVYEPVSVVKLSNPIYTLTTEQLPEKANPVVKDGLPENIPQSLDAVELSSCQRGILTTKQQEIIDLENEKVEVIE